MASDTRTVNVVDTTQPVITLSGSGTMTVNQGDIFTDPLATCTDNSGACNVSVS